MPESLQIANGASRSIERSSSTVNANIGEVHARLRPLTLTSLVHDRYSLSATVDTKPVLLASVSSNQRRSRCKSRPNEKRPKDFNTNKNINNIKNKSNQDTKQNQTLKQMSKIPYDAQTKSMSFHMMTMDITKTEPNVGLNNPQNSSNSAANNNNSISTAVNNNNNNGTQLCAGCGKHIQDRYLLRALDMLWHEDCLKCGCCDCRLGEVGSTLYTKGNLMLCKRDYLRLFGNTGYCAACSKVIPAFEMVMRARTNVYHLECFACQQCNHRFCVGDRFYLCENKILCEYDYEERLVFASMANHPILKRQVSSIGQGSPTGGGGLLGGGAGVPSGVSGGHNGVRAPGDHNNNNGPQTPNGVVTPFGGPLANHMKNSLGASS